MLVGHVAAALGAKRVEPRVPLGAALAAAFGLDLLWPLLLLTGLEVVEVSPRDTAFTNVAFVSYPWSHSLLMVVLWSAAGALIGRRLLGSWRAGAVLGLLVLSHWLLDLVTHRPDLPLWPGGPVAGLGLWDSIVGTLAVEGALLAGGVGLYVHTTRAEDRAGTAGLFLLVALLGTLWASQPWSPPPPGASAVAVGSLALWLVLPWGGWIEAHRSVRLPAARHGTRAEAVGRRD